MAGFINPMGGFNGRPQTGMQGIAMRPSVSMPMQPNMPLMPQRPPTGGPHPYPVTPSQTAMGVTLPPGVAGQTQAPQSVFGGVAPTFSRSCGAGAGSALVPQRPPTGGPHPYPMFPLPQRPPTGGPHPTQTPIPSRPQMMANALMGRR